MQRLRYSRYFKSTVILLDMLLIAGVFLYSYLRSNSFEISKEDTEQKMLMLLILLFYWVLLAGKTKLYNVERSLTFGNYLERLLTHTFVFLIGVILLAKVSRGELLLFLVPVLSNLFFILVTTKIALFVALKYIRLKGRNHRNVMFLSENETTEILKTTLYRRKDYGYRIHEYPHTAIEIPELKAFWKRNGIHTLYLPSENPLDRGLEKRIFMEAESSKVVISLLPNVDKSKFFLYDLGYIDSQPILSPAKLPLEYYSNFLVKRCADIFIALVALVFIGAWLVPLVAIIIKAGSKGPVFFRQKRYGYHDEIFTCIKFRTMYVNDECSSKITEVNDKRITKAGRFLRKTSLDEFPQFINVLKGEMSVVGPRPHMLIVDDFYKPTIRKYSVRSLVKPGITGLAQVKGLRGDSGDLHLQMKKRVLADSFYVKNWSLSMDIVIIFKTIFLLLKGDKNAR